MLACLFVCVGGLLASRWFFAGTLLDVEFARVIVLCSRPLRIGQSICHFAAVSLVFLSSLLSKGFRLGVVSQQIAVRSLFVRLGRIVVVGLLCLSVSVVGRVNDEVGGLFHSRWVLLGLVGVFEGVFTVLLS